MRSLRILIAACGVLLVTALALGQVRSFSYINFDDSVYLTDNAAVRDGLSWRSTAWALTTMHGGNWHPLTWLSHMADVSLFGMAPGPHHAVNFLIHALTSLALLLVLRAATGALWRSALVAALFAVHPLHVEAVAWVSERKEVLSALLATLAIAAWIAYARRPGRLRFLASALLFALALTAKPMPVSLPLLLLALDYWPLDRARLRSPASLVLEKAPFFLVAGISSALTLAAQTGGGAVQTLAHYSLAARAANAAEAPLVYIGRALWPARLGFFYPHAGESYSRPAFAATLVALALLTILAVVCRHRWPWLAAGWAWYLAALFPVLGLIQVGHQAGADRYTYFPLTGVLVAAAWWLPAPREPRKLAVLAAAACAVVGASAIAAHRQAGYWRDDIALFSNVLRINPADDKAHDFLGAKLQEAGRLDEAIRHHREATRLCGWCPDYPFNFANALAAAGELPEAVTQYRAALALAPDRSKTWNNLGVAQLRQGRTAAARECFEKTLALDERDAMAWLNLGIIFAAEGRPAEAIERFSRSLALDPGNWRARHHLGQALAGQGARAGAIRQYREALRWNPGSAATRAALAALGVSAP